MYQHCLPQVFRHINSVTKTEDEILAIASGTRPEITDMWETVHIEAASGAYDHEKDILEAAGFSTVLTGEDIESIRYDFGGELLGFDDETALEFLWKYVDNTISREPRNRMYLGWMSTTTHTPFKVLPDWLTQNYQAFVNDHREWQSTDAYLNAVRWTDDKVKEIILGFRERGIENETLFLMYCHY
jgi:phosphoglycerol transferase MdoB-like AlkP superfamily enzyme